MALDSLTTTAIDPHYCDEAQGFSVSVFIH